MLKLSYITLTFTDHDPVANRHIAHEFELGGPYFKRYLETLSKDELDTLHEDILSQFERQEKLWRNKLGDPERSEELN